MIKKQLYYIFLFGLLFNGIFLMQQTQEGKSLSISQPICRLYNVQTNSTNYVTSFDILLDIEISANFNVDFFVIAAFMQNSYLLTHNINVSYADYKYTDIHFDSFSSDWLHAHQFIVSLYNSTTSTSYNSSYIKIWRNFGGTLMTELNPYYARYKDVKEITASRNSTEIGMYYVLGQDGSWGPFGYTTTSGVSFQLQAFVHFEMNYSIDYLTSSENYYPKPFLPYSLYRDTNTLATTLYQRFLSILPIGILVFVVFFMIKKLTNNEKYIGIGIIPCSIFVLIYLQASILEYIITIMLSTAITLSYFKKKEVPT